MFALHPFLFVFYYISVFISLFLYVVFAKKIKIGFYSFSSVFYFICFITIFLPGFYISAGTIDELIKTNFYKGFDVELYFIYLSTVYIVPLGLLLGNILSARKYVRLQPRKYFKLRYFLALLFVALYATYYFSWLPVIPIVKLFTSGLGDAYQSRLIVTHGIKTINPPFILSYWRWFLQAYVFILFLIYYYSVLGKNKIWNVRLILFFMVVGFCLAFTIEKASFMYLMICMVMLGRIKQKMFDTRWSELSLFNNSKLLFLVGVLFLILTIIYSMFMSGGLSEALIRIFRQSAATYIQIEYVRQHGFLGLSGLDSIILSKLGIDNGENLSVWAIMQLYSNRSDAETAGSASSMFAASLYFISGWWFILWSFVYIFVIGAIDRVFSNTVLFSSNATKAILIPFYVFIMVRFGFGASVDPLMIVSFNYVLNPSIILCLLLFFFFVQYRAKKTAYSILKN